MSEGYPQRGFIVPGNATEVVLVRHGATVEAVPGKPFPLVGGHGDPPLGPEGERQSEALAERLADERFEGLFVTPLQRTRQTAAPLAARLRLEPVVVPELREVHLGEWEGGEWRIRAATGDPLVRRVFEEERWDLIPGGETMPSLAARVRAGIEVVVSTVGPGAAALVIAHGGVIAEACHQATGSRPFAFEAVDNTSISRIVVFAGGRWLLRGFNDTGHLQAVFARD
jgi:probable phosphoglycerate mutase